MEPIPNCPSELSPQQYKALKLSKVQVWEPPKEIVFEPEDTDNGELEFVFVPSPNCPSELSPQQYKLESDNTEQVCILPEETATGLGLREIVVGLVRSVFVPSPNCPSELSPQHFRSGSLITAPVSYTHLTLPTKA